MTQSEVDDLLAPVWLAWTENADRMHTRVTRVRDLGATWQQIGNYLGVSRQAAQARFGRVGAVK